MFQRLKGAIDNRIAEEQARQRQAALQASGRPPPRRRPQNASGVSRSPARPRETPSADKGPDPQEFEGEFVVGDADSKASSVKEGAEEPKGDKDGKQQQEGTNETAAQKVEPTTSEEKTGDTTGSPAPADRVPELPTDVRVKLRKLDRLESKYGELLKAYRVAHARVKVIEPFEATLRENTPLTGISDPAALVEYLNQTKVKGDLVLDELKRVTADRDDLKKKSEKLEKENALLKTNAEEAKNKAEQAEKSSTGDGEIKDATKPAVPEVTSPKVEPKEGGDAGKSPTSTSSRLASNLSFLSPRLGASKVEPKGQSEDLFSYDSEVPRLEQELNERTTQVEDLHKQIEFLRTDLKVARESTEGMMQTLEERTKEVSNLTETNSGLQSMKTELEKRIIELQDSAQSAATQLMEVQKELDGLKKQKQDFGAEAEEELRKAKEAWAATEADLKSQLDSLRSDANVINEKLSQKDQVVKDLEDSLAVSKRNGQDQAQADKSSDKKIKVMNGIMDDIRNQLKNAHTTVSNLEQELQKTKNEFEQRPSSKIFGFLDEKSLTKSPEINSRSDAILYLQEEFGLNEPQAAQAIDPTEASTAAPTNEETAGAGGRKKNKKKKKGGKVGQSNNDANTTDAPVKVSEDLSEVADETSKSKPHQNTDLANTIVSLEARLQEQVATIEILNQRIKDQEALKEEIETLRDDLLHQGEEHVKAKDGLKQSQEERKKLQESIDDLEKALSEARKQISSNSESEAAKKELDTQLQELKSKFAAMEKELKAAEKLATARFKDITDLKELLSKAQPELRNLRSEVAELKSAKEDLKNKQGELKRLEGKHEDLKSEMKSLSKRLGDKDSEIKELQQKIEQESRARSKVEDDLTSTQSDLRVAENRKKEANERSEQVSRDLSRAKEEASGLRSKVRELEDQVSSHRREVNALKEEVSLKSALHASSQALAQSLRDQTQELSTQSRESSTRVESLEEELNDAQRMLSERTRESTTMRMLLNQAETGTEARIRDMKERMDAAIEERNRVEDEANLSSRRMMRDVEDAKTKARDAQRQLKALEDQRDELEDKAREWRRRREELEKVVESAKIEVEDVKNAMKGLRDALDESERQIREAEQHRQDLRKQGEEASERIDKLTKANKNLTDEIKSLQQGGARKGSLRPAGTVGNSGPDSGIQSSRTSFDSSRAKSPPPTSALSPPPHPQRPSTSRTTTQTAAAGGQQGQNNVGLSQATVDIVYLKNVLLRFLEKKDRGPQIIPVLGMLLHFNPEEEQKFTRAITTR